MPARARDQDARALPDDEHVREPRADGRHQRPLQVGVSYLVLRKHSGRYLTSKGPDQLAKMKSSERDGGVRDEDRAELATASA